MMIAVVGFLNENPDADDAALLKAMDNNICRCCGYVKIATAVRRAAALIREAR